MIIVIESLNNEAIKKEVIDLHKADQDIAIVDGTNLSFMDTIKRILNCKTENMIFVNLFHEKDWTNAELMGLGVILGRNGFVLYLTKKDSEELLKLYSKEDVQKIDSEMVKLQLCVPVIAEEF